MPYLESPDGTVLHYKDLGSGPAVLLVHAWSLSAEMWEYQVAALTAAGFRTVAMDRRGHGRSAASRTEYDLTTLAGDLHRLVERLDLRDVTVVAHSMGTCEVVRYAALHGTGRIARVALLGTMTPYFAGAAGAAAVEQVVADLHADRPRWFREGAAAYFATAGSGSWVSRALVDDGVRAILTTPLEVQVACLRAFTLVDLRRDLAALDVPVLLLHGDADASAPIGITARPTAALLPDARLHEFPDTGHGLYVTEKAVLNPWLVDFARTGARPDCVGVR